MDSQVCVMSVFARPGDRFGRHSTRELQGHDARTRRLHDASVATPVASRRVLHQATGMESRRVEALADGIFAIAMTLLVLELRVPSLPPNATAGELARAVLLAWPKFAAYGGSFLILGVLWIGHHNQFHYVRHADRPFLWINICFLMCVGFMPYCTALLGSFIWNRTAAALYGVSLLVTGSLLYGQWIYAARHGLLSESASPAIVEATGNRILIGIGGYVVALAVSLMSPLGGLALYVAIPLFYLRQSGIDRHLAARHLHDSG
jgi:uncharacterized membrane protein